MRKRIGILLVLLSVLFSACDPDVAGEGINLPPMEFAFEVSPDTAYMKVGDTFTIQASISSTLSNGVKLTDGEGSVSIYISRGFEIPRVSFDDNFTALNNEDYKIIIEKGGVKWGKNEVNQIRSFSSSPTGDSIIMAYKFVFLKKGTYVIGGFQPLFYEGSKGKTRWNAYFNVTNPHWNELWQVSDVPAPSINEDSYKKSYLIAITE